MENFITNDKEKSLKKRLIQLIQKSDELKFLVGFFYFSGIRELYDGLRKNPNVKIKVLVGLNVDKTNKGVLEIAESDSDLSDEERVYKLLESVKNSLNREEFDTKEFYKQVKFFIDLIKKDRLIIRKSYKPNHAKLYIFKLEKGQVGRKNLFITGSSNLTSSGLTIQEEFNVEISDYGFDSAEDYFDILWGDAVKITENDSIKNSLINTIENKTLIKKPTPFEAFVLILKSYFDSFEKKEIGKSLINTLENNNYTPYQYQLDAISQALSIIEQKNGVILADVVGLGKTVIACSVAKELKKRGIIICPPGIKGDIKKKDSGWNMYKEQFGLYDWEVWSSGDLEKLQNFTKKAKDIEVVIIDEAHRFRNQDTKNYEFLKNICRNKIVILLTATPFNNKPADILSLLKLFIIPKKSNITLEDNLVDKFKRFKGAFDRLGQIKKYWNSPNDKKRKRAENNYVTMFGEQSIDLKKVAKRSHYLAKQIRDIIEPITIRRNRLDLQENPFYKKEIKKLSKLNDPKEWYFELSENQSDFYDKIIKSYFGEPEEGGQFKGAIYRPFEYETKKEKIEGEKLSEKENFQYFQQKNLYDFMRRLIVKRFESSFGSFQRSIENFKNITECVLEFIEKTDKFILDRKLLEKIYYLDVEEIEKELEEFAQKLREGDYPKNNRIYRVKKFVYKNEFINDIKSDLQLFKNILKELSALNLVKDDPKVNCLLNNLKSELNKKSDKNEPKRKIIIFSEYVDTVKYLKPILGKVFKERVLTIDGPLSNKKNREINENFDASYGNQLNQYDILLTSDKISEGYNLNRAGLVINYDIPWNPVRVIQRVGRINRIGKKVFNDLYLVNFFPTEKGSTIVKSREIAQQKMFLIHNTLGEDSKIFDVDEEPTPAGLFNKIQENPDSLEKESFYNKILKIYLGIKKEFPDIIEKVDKFPPRIKVSKKFNKNELLIFIKKGRMYIRNVDYNNNETTQINDVTLEEVFNHIYCKKGKKSLPLSDLFWDYYEQIKKPKKQKHIPVTEQSLEQRALNNLKTFISRPWKEIMPYLDFLRTLREDIIDYGTLPDYTLRRIANLEFKEKERKNTVNEIKKIKEEVGGNYLQEEKEKKKDFPEEIIIAIENQKL